MVMPARSDNESNTPENAKHFLGLKHVMAKID
jgi:hypothetical protein